MGYRRLTLTGVSEGMITRVLSTAGILGGVIWAGSGAWALLLPVIRNAPLGNALFLMYVRLVGVMVVFMLAGLVGVKRFAGNQYGRWGTHGVRISALGFLLILPATVFPNGFLPVSIAEGLPVMFFIGLFVLIIGLLLLGIASARTDTLPAPIGIFLAIALPGGFALGVFVTVVTGRKVAIPAGLGIPFGLAWAVLGGYVSQETK